MKSAETFKNDGQVMIFSRRAKRAAKILGIYAEKYPIQRISQPASDIRTFVKKKNSFLHGYSIGSSARRNIHWRSPALFRTYLRRYYELWELSTHRYHPSKPFQPIGPS